NHHNGQKSMVPAEEAQDYVLAPLGAEDGDEEADFADDQPMVIAETKTDVRTMTVGMAVMQLDLAEAPAMVFKNAAHGRLNVVYRRPDGNIGWIDPRG
ncbi:MAG: sigma 54 modulation/S30EA ribosomal C-terminal domain-containing protein, partial [Pseudomonadota bacterium]